MDLLGAGDRPVDSLSTDESYAQRYQYNKRRRELEQLQQKHEVGTDDDDDESTEEPEDEDGEQLTPQVDAAILRTLQRIRSKDAQVYDQDARVYDAAHSALANLATAAPRAKSKRVTLQDYQRERLADAMHANDPAKAYAEATSRPGPATDERAPATHLDEQERVRSEFLRAADDDAGEDDLFHVRKADGADGADARDYRSALLHELSREGGDAESDIRGVVRDNAGGDNAKTALTSENEDFLLNYILNRGWVDKEDMHHGAAAVRDWDAEAAELESDASFDSAADAFEHAYNFRFEDPSLARDAFAIQSFPRRTDDSIRRLDDRRKAARKERAERKKEEKETKMRELEQHKARKRRDIANKLRKLREVAGGDNQMDGSAFSNIDLEADFDSDEHDKLMNAQFSDGYYTKGDEATKPTWVSDADDIITENVPKPSDRKRKAVDDPSQNMDADFGPDADTKLSKKQKKQLKKKEKKEKAVTATRDAVEEDDMDADKTEKSEPASAQDHKHEARELMDEYYGLGYEDMIGDTPTRFKYAPVPKETFGMSAVDILLADDADLNNVVGLKHLQPYRRGDTKPVNLKKRLKRFHDELDSRSAGPGTDHAERPKKKRPGKKERTKAKQSSHDDTPHSQDDA
ncbi:Kinetochore protein Spc24 [Malassezia sp. CBS 17886]|nr:Kinetochore protein Spc24 [Malassezia sp. CBS 17886]